MVGRRSSRSLGARTGVSVPTRKAELGQVVIDHLAGTAFAAPRISSASWSRLQWPRWSTDRVPSSPRPASKRSAAARLSGHPRSLRPRWSCELAAALLLRCRRRARHAERPEGPPARLRAGAEDGRGALLGGADGARGSSGSDAAAPVGQVAEHHHPRRAVAGGARERADRQGQARAHRCLVAARGHCRHVGPVSGDALDRDRRPLELHLGDRPRVRGDPQRVDAVPRGGAVRFARLRRFQPHPRRALPTVPAARVRHHVAPRRCGPRVPGRRARTTSTCGGRTTFRTSASGEVRSVWCNKEG